MFQFIKQLFSKEQIDKPKLPIRDTRTLSKVELEYVINELYNKQIMFTNDLQSGAIKINEVDLEFQKLMTNRLTNNLKYKIPCLDIELVYLNGVLKEKKKMHVQYRLFHQLKENETSELTNMIVNQGYSFVPTVGYIKIS